MSTKEIRPENANYSQLSNYHYYRTERISDIVALVSILFVIIGAAVIKSHYVCMENAILAGNKPFIVALPMFFGFLGLIGVAAIKLSKISESYLFNKGKSNMAKEWRINICKEILEENGHKVIMKDQPKSESTTTQME